MKLDDLITRTCEWLKGAGPSSHIVISSRVRLARNLKSIPFSHWADKRYKEQVLEKTKAAVGASNYTKDALFLYMADLNNLDKQFLIERHLISKEHALRANHKAVVIADNEILSIMINEEDHLRIQVMQSGFNLRAAGRSPKISTRTLINISILPFRRPGATLPPARPIPARAYAPR